jgi:Arc/MetJ-type ribon-helix-helix transcriptional regulator
MTAREREKISVTIPQDLILWLDEKVRDRMFSTVSHGVELCILEGQKKYGK